MCSSAQVSVLPLLLERFVRAQLGLSGRFCQVICLLTHLSSNFCEPTKTRWNSVQKKALCYIMPSSSVGVHIELYIWMACKMSSYSLNLVECDDPRGESREGMVVWSHPLCHSGAPHFRVPTVPDTWVSCRAQTMQWEHGSRSSKQVRISHPSWHYFLSPSILSNTSPPPIFPYSLLMLLGTGKGDLPTTATVPDGSKGQGEPQSCSYPAISMAVEAVGQGVGLSWKQWQWWAGSSSPPSSPHCSLPAGTGRGNPPVATAVSGWTRLPAQLIPIAGKGQKQLGQ